MTEWGRSKARQRLADGGYVFDDKITLNRPGDVADARRTNQVHRDLGVPYNKDSYTTQMKDDMRQSQNISDTVPRKQNRGGRTKGK